MSREIVHIDGIARSIFLLRGQKVMLDCDLATLYGVATKVLNQAVKRNRERFPEDFMFRLTGDEAELCWRSRSQVVTLKRGQNVKYPPYAFTEQGVAMLSSVLRSERAAKVNIAIMRAFVKLREMLETNRELARKFADLEGRVGKQDEEIAAIIEAIRQLMVPAQKPKREIGFHVRERTARYRTTNHR
jgi:phage regulator Rha-like protein